jgi:hypothetical protein
MSNTAILSFDPSTAMWKATFAGNVISESTNKSYIRMNIENGTNKKANLLRVSKCEEIGMVSTKEQAVELIQFDINERFEFLADYVDMVASRDMKSTIICGSGGLGKSYTVFRQLAKNNIVDVTSSVANQEDGSEEFQKEMSNLIGNNSVNEYVTVKGYTTAKGLFRTLYENRNRTIVFDDCDSALQNDTSANLLKAALDSYSKRIVTWNAESFGKDSDLPKSFEFTGGVIFISNLPMAKIPQALISRSAPADVSMTREEVITRMRMIVSGGEFMDDVDMNIKTEALDFIEKHIDNPQIQSINLRTLIAVVTNRRCKPANWERLSLSLMIAAR